MTSLLCPMCGAGLDHVGEDNYICRRRSYCRVFPYPDGRGFVRVTERITLGSLMGAETCPWHGSKDEAVLQEVSDA